MAVRFFSNKSLLSLEGYALRNECVSKLFIHLQHKYRGQYYINNSYHVLF